MNFKSTIVLFIITAIVVVAAIVLPKHYKPTDEVKVSADKVFKDFETKKATKMELKKGDVHVVAEKKNDTWYLTTPLNDRADKDKVEGVLSACEFLRYKGIVKPESGTVDLAKYGLDKPQAEVLVADAKGSHTLLVGGSFEGIDKSSASGSKVLYVQVKGKPEVYAVGDDIVKDIDKKLIDFRSRKPFDLTSYRVEKLELANEHGTIVAAKKDDDWFLEKPVADKAETSKLSDLVSAVSSAEKVDFTADGVTDFAQYGLDKPAITARFWSKEEQGSKTLLLGKPIAAADAKPEDKPEKVYACVEGDKSVFTLKNDVLEKLVAKANDLRERSLTEIKSDDVVAVAVKTDKGTIALEKDGFDWKMTEPKELKADSTAAQDVAKLIQDAEVSDWIDKPADLAQYGLDKPLTITLKKKKEEDKDQEMFELLAGKKDGDSCYVKLPGKPWVMKAPAGIAELADRGYLSFRSKRMFDFTRNNCKKLTIARKDGLLFTADKVDDTKWSVSKPVAGQAEMSNVNNVLWDLCTLDAEKLIEESPKDLAQYGLNDPDVTATASVETPGAKADDKPETRAYTVQIGKAVPPETKDDKPAADAAPTAFYAKADGQDIIFTVRKSVVDSLKASLLSLNVVKYESNDATKITIARGTDQIVCERKDKDADWQITSPADQKGDSDKIQRISDELHLLRALEYAEYNPNDLAKYGLDKPAAVITVKVANDQDKVLQIGAKRDDGSAYARTADATPVFVVSKYSLEQIDKDLAGLRPDEKKPEDQKDEAKPDGESGDGEADVEVKDEPAE